MLLLKWYEKKNKKKKKTSRIIWVSIGGHTGWGKEREVKTEF